MATTIVETIPTKVPSSVLNERVHQTVFGAKTTDASRPLGTVMVMMIVEIRVMNRKITARVKNEPALVICSLVTMATVYHASTFVMAITTV